jgi:hypothetical protein
MWPMISVYLSVSIPVLTGTRSALLPVTLKM